MAPRSQAIIKTFKFDDSRSFTFSDASLLTLNEGEWIELKKDDADFYPVEQEALLYTGTHEAQAFRAFRNLFQAGVSSLEDPEGNTEWAAKVFRVYNGTDEFYFDGDAWVAFDEDVTDVVQWNTEGEVSAALSAWDIPLVGTGGVKGKFGFVIRLYTSDKNVSPKIHWVKCAYNAKVHSWLEDIVVRSLAGAFKTQIRPVTELVVKTPDPATDSINVASILSAASAPFVITDIDDAFNATQDVELVANVESAYDPTTKMLTLTTTPEPGDIIRIGAIYAPPVLIEVGNQDFIETAKAPNIVLHSIGLAHATQMPNDETIVSKWDGAGLTVKAPQRVSVTFDITLNAPSNIDLLRMIDSVIEFFEANPVIKSKAIGELYRLRLMDKFSNRTQASHSGAYCARGRGEIIDVLFFKVPAEVGFGVKELHLTGDVEVIIDIEAVDADTIIGE
jgi:hypothetical protein